jgi:hypothetical protein
MVQINFARKEVNCKVVFYGCGLCGKTTNLEIVHEKAPPDRKGELTSIATEGDRTLFFDFMPLELGKVGGMNTKFQLYTVPGQVYYNATRKLVLQGTDGIIFVVDSKKDKLQENIDSFKNLEENLKEQGLDLKKIPHVIQYNKRDLPDAAPVAELDKAINWYGAPTFEAVAKTGEGVFPTLKKLSSMILENLNKQYGVGGKGGAAPGAKEAAPAGAKATGELKDAKAPAAKPPAEKKEEKPAAKPPAEKKEEKPAAKPAPEKAERKEPPKRREPEEDRPRRREEDAGARRPASSGPSSSSSSSSSSSGGSGGGGGGGGGGGMMFAVIGAVVVVAAIAVAKFVLKLF